MGKERSEERSTKRVKKSAKPVEEPPAPEALAPTVEAAAADAADTADAAEPAEAAAPDAAAAGAAAEGPPAEDAIVEETLRIPAAGVELVCGKTGAALKALQASSGASIVFSEPKADATPADLRIVTLRGPAPSVAAAKAAVERAVARVPGPTDFLRIPVARDRVNWVLGQKGSTISALRLLTGAEIDLKEEIVGRSVSATVVVKGTPSQVAEAKEALFSICGKDSATSRSYSLRVQQAAEQRREHDLKERARKDIAAADARLRAFRGITSAEDAAAAAAVSGEAAARADAKQWRLASAPHPDGSTVPCWIHVTTGEVRF